MDLEQYLAYRDSLRSAVQLWLYDPNVSFIDVGHPEHDGEIAWEEVEVCIHVREKIPLAKLERAIAAGKTLGRIPKEINGIPVDIPKSEIFTQFWPWWGGVRTRQNPRTEHADPLNCGISLGNERRRSSYGTLGAIVEDRQTAAPMLLSNWHVLAGDWGAGRGQRIFQPAFADGGDVQDLVARLEREVISSNLDAAVARIETGSRCLSNEQFGIGSIESAQAPALDLEVTKSGRASQVTRGRITTAVPGIQKMYYRGVTRYIREVWRVEPRETFEEVSRGGDSGSLWVSSLNNQAVGLHFAGANTPERALMMNIEIVLDALNVDLVTPQTIGRWNATIQGGG
jgi:hypothetical protein